MKGARLISSLFLFAIAGFIPFFTYSQGISCEDLHDAEYTENLIYTRAFNDELIGAIKTCLAQYQNELPADTYLFKFAEINQNEVLNAAYNANKILTIIYWQKFNEQGDKNDSLAAVRHFQELLRIKPREKMDDRFDVFHALYPNFLVKPDPLWEVDLLIGFNQTLIRTPAGSNNQMDDGGIYTGKVKWLQAGINAEHNIGSQFSDQGFSDAEGKTVGWLNNVWIKIGLLYQIREFEWSDSLFGNLNLIIKEKQSLYKIPVLLKYNLLKTDDRNRMNVNLLAGIQFNMLQNSKVTARKAPVDGVSVENIFNPKSTGLRNIWTTDLYAGLEFSFDRWFLQISYAYGLDNQVNTDYRYADRALFSNYGYVDNDFKISSIDMSIGMNILSGVRGKEKIVTLKY